MNKDEFRAKGEAVFGGAWGWQSALARILDVDSARIRDWLAGRRSVPDGVAAELGALYAAAGANPLSTDVAGPEAASIPEWLIGSEAPATDEAAAEFLIHTRRPRFIAVIVDEAEDGAALGREVHVDGEWALAVTWQDRRPEEEERRVLLRRAFAELGESAF